MRSYVEPLKIVNVTATSDLEWWSRHRETSSVQITPNKRLIADQQVKPHLNNRKQFTTTVVVAGYTIDRENAKPLGNSAIIATKLDILRGFAGLTDQQLEFDDVAGRLSPSQATAGLYHL
jgi:hypothetical protein